MQRRYWSVALAGVCLLAGCAPTTPSPPLVLSPLESNGSLIPHAGREVRGPVIVRDAVAWESLWAEIHQKFTPVPPLPVVDFTAEIVVGFALGLKPSSGFSVRLHDPTWRRGVVTIEVEETNPGPGCAVLTVMTSPLHLARLTRSDGPIEFDPTSIIKNCGP
jgi:hypothetical protein